MYKQKNKYNLLLCELLYINPDEYYLLEDILLFCINSSITQGQFYKFENELFEFFNNIKKMPSFGYSKPNLREMLKLLIINDDNNINSTFIVINNDENCIFINNLHIIL